jgi:hypothetical protein
VALTLGVVNELMGREYKRVAMATIAVASTALLVGAVDVLSPRSARPGLWDISLSANGSNSRRACLADPMILTQWEHRRSACTRVVIAEHGAQATVHYTCSGGGFGQSAMTLLTPRSIRVETQGISDGLPFDYVLHARRAGDCPVR